MKKWIVCLLIAMLVMSCTACGKTSEEALHTEPDVVQMQEICELATMKCFYRNVAKVFQEDAEGFLWWKKDLKFWIEYSGEVIMGIDAQQLKVEIANDVVEITLPEAKVLGCKVNKESLSKASYIVDKKSADVNWQQEIQAFDKAQKDLEETAARETALLASARQRAKHLLEEYVTNIGNAVGKDYKIRWIYPESNPQVPSETQ